MSRGSRGMTVRFQVIGASRLTRVVVPYLLEKDLGRVVAIDPAGEDETLPWFAPVRQLARDNGIPLGRRDADCVLDLDPDGRPDHGEGVLIRVFPPADAPSADVNRMLLTGGEWSMVVTEPAGRAAWGARRMELGPADDAGSLMNQATLKGLEVLADNLEGILAGATAVPLPRPLRPGRWRPQESFVVWEQPAERVVARIRAASGPYGGARTHLGDTSIFLEDAEVVGPRADLAGEADQPPGTIVGVDSGILVSTGKGIVRLGRLRPSWRPLRMAAEFATEVGATVGYQFA